MINLNEVLVSGRLAAKPESVLTKNGHHITKFTIASNDPYKKKDGSWGNHVNWIKVTRFGLLPDFLSNRLDKGTPVLVKGKIRVSSSESKDDKKANYYFEVIASRISTDTTKTDNVQDPSSSEVSDNVSEFSDFEAELADMENPLFDQK
jgi:single-strand DNA-binding protein